MREMHTDKCIRNILTVDVLLNILYFRQRKHKKMNEPVSMSISSHNLFNNLCPLWRGISFLFPLNNIKGQVFF